MKDPTNSLKSAFRTGFAWGLAEGLFLFIVPDVLLCYWAMKSWKKAFTATLSVVLGALLGGVLLYGTLVIFPEAYSHLHAFWGSLPGFKPKMAEVAATHLHAGARGLLSGPSSGIPYRVYVLEAWKQGVPLIQILLWTPIARLERIIIAPLAVLGLRLVAHRLLAKRFPRLPLQALIGGFIILYWIGLYAWYWGVLVPKVYG